MYTLSLSLLALMATPSLSTPLHPLYPRQFTNTTSTSSMTQTFTETTLLTASTFISSNTSVAAANATIPANATILAASASASATQAPCNATYSCTPGQSCADVAGRHGITLSVYEADSACDSKNCKDIMRGYQLCYNGTADASIAKANSSLPLANVAANSTAAGTGTAPLSTGTTSVEIIKDTLRNTTTAAGTGTGAARVAATTSLPMFKDAVKNSTTAAAATGVASAKVAGNATTAATTTDIASAKVNGNATAVRVSTTTEVKTVTGASGNSTMTVFRTITESAQAASKNAAPSDTTSSLKQDKNGNTTAAGTLNVAAETTSTIVQTVPQESNVAGSQTNNAYATPAAPSTSDASNNNVAAPAPLAPNGTHIIVATDLAELTVTLTATTTLTYMLGTGSAKAERTALVTHTSFSVLKTSSEKPAVPAPTLAETKETSTPKEDRISGTGTESSKPLNSPTSSTEVETPANTNGKMAPALAACSTVSPPAPTQSGVVSGCTKWYIAQEGDWCSTVANTNDISVDTFMANNPGTGADCKNLWAGDAYCVKTCDDGTPVVADKVAVKNGVQNAGDRITTSTSAGAADPTAEDSVKDSDDSKDSAEGSDSKPSDTSANVYETYRGDGSGPDGANWPTEDIWTSSFDTMFAANKPTIGCEASWNVADNSDNETSAIRSAITTIADETDVDARFILAVLMQESKGCVRVPTTDNGVTNPGLMQSHNGSGSCSDAAAGQCKDSDIEQMVRDGVTGTSSGDGLKALLQGQRDAGYDGAQAYYRAARAYNGGLSGLQDQLEDGCCTKCYASDIANRLTGWSSGPSSCDL